MNGLYGVAEYQMPGSNSKVYLGTFNKKKMFSRLVGQRSLISPFTVNQTQLINMPVLPPLILNTSMNLLTGMS